ncbi:MAG: isocitrate lyase/PEP mutase family protein [Rhizobiaceae bacterium]|nr:isocitrate lyase/PEP mutase family protein [Hyphomicrobiales bacterium]NRB30189.1 isocitrate lyase/PEP mutase family protein [Rhizobiaceae bacterium]
MTSGTTASAARKQLRQIIDGDACVFPASVHDPISVRIAEELGFEMGMFAGSVASLTVLGAPDVILLTLSEFADQARRITRGCGLPVFCDADHGYGNALNVKRTVEELETAGVAGLSIEDTDLPIQHGSNGKASLLSIEEGVGKIRAAVAARQDQNLVIAGRTGAASMTDSDDATRRLVAYEQAGADILFTVGIKTPEQLQTLSSATSLPLFLGGLPVDMMDREELARHRVRIALQGHQPFAAAVQAIYDTLAALRSGTMPADLERVASKETMARLMRRDRVDSDIDDFLS